MESGKEGLGREGITCMVNWCLHWRKVYFTYTDLAVTVEIK